MCIFFKPISYIVEWVRLECVLNKENNLYSEMREK